MISSLVYFIQANDVGIYEDDYAYYYDDEGLQQDFAIENETTTVEVPVLDEVQMLELGLLTEDGWNKTIEFTSVVNDTVDELTAPMVDFSAKSDEVHESNEIEGDSIYTQSK